MGRALAKHLHVAGYPVKEIVGRRLSRQMRQLASQIGASAPNLRDAKLKAELVWLCVPDSLIATLANQLASREWKGKIALHSSGVLTSEALIALRNAGASVASAHPLMTFVPGTMPELKKVPFAMEGDRAAVQAAGRVVRRLGGRAVAIRKQDKRPYHLFATMVCPLLISLLAASEKAAEAAGLSRVEAKRRMLPIIRQTILNYENFGAAAAFTGPFARGDVETVRLHLQALSRSPGIRAVYLSLAESALRNLPHRNAKEIRAALREEEGISTIKIGKKPRVR